MSVLDLGVDITVKISDINPLLFDSLVIVVGSVSSQMFVRYTCSIPRFGTFFHQLSATGKR